MDGGFFQNLRGSLMGLGDRLRPAAGAFAPGNPNSGPTMGPGGWSTSVQSGFAHPNNPMRRALGTGLMAMGSPMLMNGSKGALDPNILANLMAMRQQWGSRRGQ